MRHHSILCLFLCLVLDAATPGAAPIRPVLFEPGAKPHEFVSRAGNGALRLTPNGVEFAAAGHRIVRLSLAGARATDPRGDELLHSTSSYYLGNNPSHWRTEVPNYNKVRYDGVYPGIDLVLRGSDRSFEYDFVVAPHSDPSRIRMRFDGRAKLSLNSHGDLVIGDGWLSQHRPRVYQDTPQGRREVAARFRVHRDHTVSFQIDPFDRARELVIDPVIRYSTYLGGVGEDVGYAVAVDNTGNVYVGGLTVAYNFPGSVDFGQRPLPNQEGFIAKFGPIAGGKSELLYSIFLGDDTDALSIVLGLAVDPTGNIAAVGETIATGFPLLNAVQTKIGGGLDCTTTSPNGGPTEPILCPDAFVTKFTGDGKLVFSTYYGGRYENFFNAVATDSDGGIYAVGIAAAGSGLVGTPNAIQPSDGSQQDMKVAQFDPTGKVVYSTYLGGSVGPSVGSSIAVEKPGVVWIAGHTLSPDMLFTANAYLPKFSATQFSGYVARIDMTQPGQAGLTYATFFGSQGDTVVNHVFLDGTGQVVFCGGAYAVLPLTPTAFQGFQGGPASSASGTTFFAGDGFIARINPAVVGTDGLTYSSYVGGANTDQAISCALDPQGRFLVTGDTYSQAPFLQPGSPIPLKPSGAGINVFAIRIDPTKSGGLVDSILFGGENDDTVNAMALDAHGYAYLTGATQSLFFPVSPNAFQKQPGGASTNPSLVADGGSTGDAWLMQLDLNATEMAVAALAMYSGDFQFGAPNSTLTAPLLVNLADSNGNLLQLAGYAIDFAASGGATVANIGVTDGSGTTGTYVKLGATDATVTASIPGTTLSYNFHLKAISGTLPASVAVVSGNNQSGSAGAALAQPLVVQLQDPTGAALPLAGLTVQFQPTNATVGPPTAVTDSTGRASTTVMLGSQTGSATVNVIVGSLAPVIANFTATASLPTVAAVVNGASFAGGGIVAGEIATIFGANLTSSTGINLTSSLPLPMTFLNTSVIVNNRSAALFAVDNVNGQQQINFQVPWEVGSGGNATVAVEINSATGASISVPVLAAQPGIFNYTVGGNTFGAILHANFQLADSDHPATAGETVLIYCTGLGAVSSPPEDGVAGKGQSTTASPTVTIGGARASVSFSGLAPGFVGLYQVNVKVPSGLGSGNKAVVINMGDASSKSVLLPVG